MEKMKLNVSGMSCAHCEKAVVNGLTDIGACNVTASFKTGEVEFEHDLAVLTLEEIMAEIVDMGYEVLAAN